MPRARQANAGAGGARSSARPRAAAQAPSARAGVKRAPARAKTSTPSRRVPPSLRNERDAWDEGHDVIVGIDEVGRGAWAGPLAIGAVVLDRSRRVNGVRDSKMLSERRREELYSRLTRWCRAWSVGMVSAQECDDLGMSAAQKLAARRAIEGLGLTPDRVLLDGNWDFVGDAVAAGSVTRIVKGDATCLSIATASVIAKVTRDRLMRAEDEHFPAYNFAANKGYPCPVHKAALQGFGPSTIHRRSWVFMDHLLWGVERVGDAAHAEQPSLFDWEP